MPVPTLCQPTDRLPHGPDGQLSTPLPQPDGLLPAAVPRTAGLPSWLLPGAQALPCLLGLRLCAAPRNGGLITLATYLRLRSCRGGPGYLNARALQSPTGSTGILGRDGELGEKTLTFALFGRTLGKEQLQPGAAWRMLSWHFLPEKVSKGLPVPGSCATDSLFPLDSPDQHAHFLCISPLALHFVGL